MTDDRDPQALHEIHRTLRTRGVLRAPRTPDELDQLTAPLRVHGDVLASFVRTWFQEHDGSDELPTDCRVLSATEAIERYTHDLRFPINQSPELQVRTQRFFPLIARPWDSFIGVLWDITDEKRADLPILFISGEVWMVAILDCNWGGLLSRIDNVSNWRRAWTAVPHLIYGTLGPNQFTPVNPEDR